MKLCVLSGKGGAGKTTFAVNLALCWGRPVCLVDCDVEEPDCHIFLHPENPASEQVSVQVPEVDASLCDACGKCSSFCQYHAIAKLGSSAITFPELCHSCGGCSKVCPEGAIKEVSRKIGDLSSWSSHGVGVVQGLMDIGHPAAPPLIRALKAKASSVEGDLIFDCPPGASCPASTAVRGCDFALLVCEPTPFGVHDMTIAASMLKEMAIPFAVAINKSGAGDILAAKACSEGGIEILGRLEESLETARTLSRGGLLAKSSPMHREMFESLAKNIRDHVSKLGGRQDGKAI